MAISKDGKTDGITLRIKKEVLDAYDAIAARNNAAGLKSSGRRLVTAQDVMRQVLEAHPEVTAELGRQSESNGKAKDSA